MGQFDSMLGILVTFCVVLSVSVRRPTSVLRESFDADDGSAWLEDAIAHRMNQVRHRGRAWERVEVVSGGHCRQINITSYTESTISQSVIRFRPPSDNQSCVPGLTIS